MSIQPSVFSLTELIGLACDYDLVDAITYMNGSYHITRGNLHLDLSSEEMAGMLYRLITVYERAHQYVQKEAG
jgi:hypothetical protein